MSESATGQEATVETATVRLPKEMVRQLAIIAQRAERPISEIVGGWIATRLAREYRQVVTAMSQELGGEAG